MKIYKRRCREICIWDNKRSEKIHKATVYGLTPQEALEFAKDLLKCDYEIKSTIADDREIWGYHYRYYPIENKDAYLLIEDNITLTNTKTIDMVEECEILHNRAVLLRLFCPLFFQYKQSFLKN